MTEKPSRLWSVLIVEDDYLVSLLLGDLLVDLGHRIVGPASDVANALELAQREEMDIAVLDVNLRGSDTYPIAAALAARAQPHPSPMSPPRPALFVRRPTC